jgi:hypothetical protein
MEILVPEAYTKPFLKAPYARLSREMLIARIALPAL